MKQGGRPIQRLNLRLLVHAEHQGMVRRIDVQPDDIAHLLDQLRVWRQLEGLAAMRLQPKGLPNALDGHVTQARHLRHIARAPMRRPTRRGLQGRNHHLLHLRIGNPPWRARARFVDQPLQPVAQKARAPLAHGGPRDVEASGDAGRRPAGRTGQDDAGAPRHLRGTPRPVGPRVEPLPFVFTHCDCHRGRTSHVHLLSKDTPRSPTVYLFLLQDTSTRAQDCI